MHIYYTYIIKCNDGTLYVGVTNDLERRFAEHSSGQDPRSYTSKRRPLRLVHFETFQWVREAIRREEQLKGWSAQKKRALIRSDEDILHQFASCRNHSSHNGFSAP